MPYSYYDDYAIVSAAGSGALRELKKLLDRGGDPNAECFIMYGDYVFTALGEAYAGKHYDAMDMLLSYGANPDMDYDYYANVIHAIAHDGDMQALDVLFNYSPDLEKKGRVYFRDAQGRSVLSEPLIARDVAEKRGHTEFVALIDRYTVMPSLHEDAAVDKATLLTKNAHGDCMLDHPSTWRQFERVGAELQAQGEHLTAAEMQPHLHRAVSCHALDKALAALHANGEALRADALLGADGRPNALLEHIITKGQVQELFQVANWQGGDLQELTRLYRALPESAQDLITNYRSLRAQVSPKTQGVGRSVRGGGFGL